MYQSILISGGTKDQRLAKTLTLLPFEINEEIKNQLLSQNAPNHPDIYLLTPENSIGIGEIKDLENKIRLRPVMSTHKVAIINEAHTLTVEAQNAFLKTLEEPPDYVVFLLLAQDKDLLLPTVISRCRVVNLTPDSNSFSPEEITKTAREISEILNMRVGERLIKTAELAKTRDEAIIWLEKSIFFFRYTLLSHYCHSDPPAGGEESHQSNDKLSPSEIISLIRQCMETKSLLQKNINVRLALDNLLLQWPIQIK